MDLSARHNSVFAQGIDAVDPATRCPAPVMNDRDALFLLPANRFLRGSAAAEINDNDDREASNETDLDFHCCFVLQAAGSPEGFASPARRPHWPRVKVIALPTASLWLGYRQ